MRKAIAYAVAGVALLAMVVATGTATQAPAVR